MMLEGWEMFPVPFSLGLFLFHILFGRSGVLGAPDGRCFGFLTYIPKDYFFFG